MAGKSQKVAKYHLEIQRHRKNPYGLLRTTTWDPVKKMPVHETRCRITGMSLEQLERIQAAIQGKTIAFDKLEIAAGREYGASAALHALAHDIGLDTDIYSRPNDDWVQCTLAMIIGRIIYQGSKLSLAHIGSLSALWEICGVTDATIDVDTHCYNALDELLKRQELIQKKLAARHLHNGIAVLYDITSSYFEGQYEDSKLVTYGYNRDKKRGKKQVVIGLICAENGCPVSVEVFKGNTRDSDTVSDKFKEIKDRYGITEAIFVGDRGMLTAGNLEKSPYKTITALRHDAIKKLVEEKHVQLSLFDEKIVNEVELPEEPGVRYALCLNPVRREKEHKTRQALIAKTEEKLTAIAHPKKKTTAAQLGIRVGKVINKYNAARYFELKITDDRVTWTLREEKIEAEKVYDGLYVIRSDVEKAVMDGRKLVETYRKLSGVEQAFRILKTVQLELRPVYHHKDERIRAHAFVCMLSYYLLWHLEQRLEPLYASDGNGKNRAYTLKHILEELKNIQKQKVILANHETWIVSTPNLNQQKILESLNVKIR